MNSSGTMTLNNTIIRNNLGGIYNYATLTLNNSVVSGNIGGSDGPGGVYNVGGTVNVNNSTISGNTVSGNGGGIFNFGAGFTTPGAVTVNNSTITGNIANIGAGIYNTAGNTVTLKNSILARNIGGVTPDCSGPISSAGYNLIGNNSGCTFTSATGDLVGTNANPINPRLTPLQNDAGPNLTHALISGSPAIDAGNPAVPGSGGNACLSTDQRGIARPAGSRCDIGAYEGSVSSPIFFTYTANNLGTLPGALLCTQAQPTCTNGADPHSDAAHRYAADTYNFYATYHSRSSIDDNGMIIFSTVHYGGNYANAFWNGMQIVFGDGYGFPLADDVVAHELTHGVTQYESNLFYYYQSGAINESFSDVWGEFVDLTNGAGNDSAAVRWKMGEDVTGLGALRDMKNPPAFGDPDKMTSSLYYKGARDNGGVHTNSGVNNKAVYLITDGGTFNGKAVTALGIPKAAAIYYEAQVNLLTSGADYADLYNALYQACLNLAGGPQGITSADCQEVRDATDAVQMNSQPAAGYNPEAALCPTGMAFTSSLFLDNLETSDANWTFDALSGPNTWIRTTEYAASGLYELYGNNSAGPFLNSFAAMNVSATTLPANAFLHFKHAFGFEDYAAAYFFDGGLLEYSTDSGVNWLDAKPLFSGGKNYGGKIYTGFGNPNSGRDAFVADSHGYVSSRYNLNSLAGQNVRFRWRVSTDDSFYDIGWFVDDVQIYTCTGVPGVPALLSPANNALTNDYTPTLDWADLALAPDHYQVQIDDNADFSTPTDDQTVTPSTYTPTTPLSPNTTFYWRARAFNGLNQPGNWSAVRSLRTALTPPTGLSAPDAANTSRPKFDWNNVTGATGYTIQVSTSAVFATFAVNASVAASEFTPAADLPRNVTLYWRVRANGANGPGDWTNGASFISANPPGVPVLVAPANGSLTTDYTPLLNWNDSTGLPDHYQIQVATSPTFASPVIDDSTLTISDFTPGSNLAPNLTHYWRVRTYNAAGQFSAWSAVWSFRTALTPPASLTAPDAALVSRPRFDWDNVTGATGYTLQVSTSAVFATFAVNANVVASEFTPAADLPRNVTLYWRVRANGANGPSDWTNGASFTSANPPAAPVPASPANGALVIGSPTLTWNAPTVPAGTTLDHYEVQVSTSSSFTTIVQQANTGTTSYTTTSLKGLYYWRVRAVNTEGEYGPWSTVRNFRVR